MSVLAYGEDPLTFWAVCFGLRSVLGQLGDQTPTEEATVIYRPSFGRRAGSETQRRSEFGEFDAIVGTPAGIYLIETKWNGSSEFKNGMIALRDEQIRRHDVLRRYLALWRKQPPASSDAFYASCRDSLESMCNTLTVPRRNTKLARNLSFVLQTLAPLGHKIHDVLVFVALDNDPFASHVSPKSFRLVNLRRRTTGGTAYFVLDG